MFHPKYFVFLGAYVDLQKCYLRPINSVKVETLSSDVVFQTMSDKIKNTPELVKKINGIFAFNITENGTVVKTWSKFFPFFKSNFWAYEYFYYS